MSVRFGAPWPTLQTFINLPSPQFGNSEANTATVEFRRLQINFDMTQAKGFELLEFIRSYHAVQIQYIDELNQTWIGYFVTNPNQTQSRALAVSDPNSMYAHVTIQVEFEGLLQ